MSKEKYKQEDVLMCEELYPEEGSYFITKDNELAVMVEPRRYQLVGERLRLNYVPHSKFSMKRLATVGDILTVRNEEQEMSDRLDSYFLATLEEGHNTKTGLRTLEAEYIEHVHKMCKFNQSKTAIALGLSRGCLRMKLNQYFPGKYL